MRRELLLWICCAIFVLEPIAERMGGTGAAFAQQQEDVQAEVRALIKVETASLTTARNVRERHKKLGKVLGMLMRSNKGGGLDIDTVFSSRDELKVRELLADGKTAQAAGLIHNAIMKLKWLDASQPLSSGHSRPAKAEVSAVYDFHAMANSNLFDNILKLMNPVIDAANRRMYVTGGKSTSVGVIDLDKIALIETFDIGRTGGFLIHDSKKEDLYLFDIAPRKFFRISIGRRTRSPVDALPAHVSMPEKDAPLFYKGMTYHGVGGYPFRAGYLQDKNASYAVIEARDSSGKPVYRFMYGPDALYHTIDTRTGRLYASITGSGSISVLDLNNRAKQLKTIDVGTSVEQVVLHPETGGFFVRNRLGGSTIFYYEPNNRLFKEIPNENSTGGNGIGMWPTAMIYDEGKLYVLSHYAGRIDVIDAGTFKIVDRIDLKLSLKPRTDALSTMVMDRRRKILYAAFPELGEIAAANAGTSKFIGTLKISRFDTSRNGPAIIVLSVDEKKNRLLAYLALERRLDVYTGGKLSLVDRLAVDAGRHEGIMTVNPERNFLYLGREILDLSSFKRIDRFSKGERVVGFDNRTDRVYLASSVRISEAKKTEVLHEFRRNVLRREFTLAPILDTASSFAFDFNANRCFVGGFESATVTVYDLSRTSSGK